MYTPWSPAVVSNIKLMQEKTLRKHSLYEKTAASVLLKQSIITLYKLDLSSSQGPILY